MIAFAIGAATPLPLLPFSTMTATAICGFSTGANAINRAWSLSRSAIFASHAVRGASAHGACGASGTLHNAVHGADHRVPVGIVVQFDVVEPHGRRKGAFTG
jgi:hypothetical protein